jgi:hypothetical protein
MSATFPGSVASVEWVDAANLTSILIDHLRDLVPAHLDA